MNPNHNQEDLPTYWVVIHSEVFFQMVKEISDRLLIEKKIEKEELFISEKEAMKILGFKSKTSMQKLRDFSEIIFYKISNRKILYDKKSIYNYIQNKKESFYNE